MIGKCPHCKVLCEYSKESEEVTCDYCKKTFSNPTDDLAYKISKSRNPFQNLFLFAGFIFFSLAVFLFIYISFISGENPSSYFAKVTGRIIGYSIWIYLGVYAFNKYINKYDFSNLSLFIFVFGILFSYKNIAYIVKYRNTTQSALHEIVQSQTGRGSSASTLVHKSTNSFSQVISQQMAIMKREMADYSAKYDDLDLHNMLSVESLSNVYLTEANILKLELFNRYQNDFFPRIFNLASDYKRDFTSRISTLNEPERLLVLKSFDENVEQIESFNNLFVQHEIEIISLATQLLKFIQLYRNKIVFENSKIMFLDVMIMEIYNQTASMLSSEVEKKQNLIQLQQSSQHRILQEAVTLSQ